MIYISTVKRFASVSKVTTISPYLGFLGYLHPIPEAVVVNLVPSGGNTSELSSPKRNRIQKRGPKSLCQ
jgi:hypothetical protein